MEEPSKRLLRVLESLSPEMQRELAINSSLLIGLQWKPTGVRNTGRQPIGELVHVPTSRDLCKRIRDLTQKTRIDSEFLITSLLQRLERRFEAAGDESLASDAIDQGLYTLQELEHQATLAPDDDRAVVMGDADLAGLIFLIKTQMTEAPNQRQLARDIASILRKILVEEFSAEYWSELDQS